MTDAPAAPEADAKRRSRPPDWAITVVLSAIAIALGVLAAIAIVRSEPESVTQPVVSVEPVPPPAPPPPPRPVRANSKLTFDGLAGLTIGQSPTEALRATGQRLLTRASEVPICRDGGVQGAPRGVSVLLVQDQLERIGVTDPQIRTDRGVGIGSTAQAVQSAYGEANVEGPDNSQSGPPTITAFPVNPMNLNRMVFTLDGGRVSEIAVGSTAYAPLRGCPGG